MPHLQSDLGVLARCCFSAKEPAWLHERCLFLGMGGGGEGRGACIRQAEQGQEDVALRQSPIHHLANLTEHLQVPGSVLSPAGLETPQALLSRSLRIGQEDGFEADGRSCCLWMGREGKEG